MSTTLGPAKVVSPAIRDPNKLCPCAKSRYLDLRMLTKKHNLGVTLIETLRMPDRQVLYMAMGVSWTMNSMHLPQPPNGLSLAIDIVPVDYLTYKSWNPLGEQWTRLQALGELAGWHVNGPWRSKDLAHMQLDKCLCTTPTETV